MAASTREISTRLCDLLATKPPVLTGYLPLLKEHKNFFYLDQKDQPHVIDICNPAESAFADLFAACQPAKFGLGNEDTYDETYRKAGKMDVDRFATLFSPAESGIASALNSWFLSDMEGNTKVRAELYKLNVYGPGGFFRAHQDTPRSPDMFGSLVVVLPSPHEGGALALRQHDKAWTFETAQLPFKASEEVPTPSIHFVAFYGDVEHEVLPVTLGHRITLTYNLYYNKSASSVFDSRRKVNPALPYLEINGQIEEQLEALISDPLFLPEGGNVGFGLRYMYALDNESPLESILDVLKGSDAILAQALCLLGFVPRPYMLFEDDKDYYYDCESEIEYYFKRLFLVGHNPLKEKFGYMYEVQNLAEKMKGFVLLTPEGKLETKVGGLGSGAGEGQQPLPTFDNSMRVQWITTPKVSGGGGLKVPYIAYGNEVSMEYTYGYFVIVASVNNLEARKLRTSR